MVSAGVMHRMTVVMAVTTRRKTCFPTVGTTITTKAKPPAVTAAFCVYFSPSPTTNTNISRIFSSSTKITTILTT